MFIKVSRLDYYLLLHPTHTSRQNHWTVGFSSQAHERSWKGAEVFPAGWYSTPGLPFLPTIHQLSQQQQCFSLTLCFLMGAGLKFDVPFIKTLALSDRVGNALQGLQTISSCLSSSVSHGNSTSHFSSYLRRRWLWSYNLECSRLSLSLSFRFSAGFFTPGICFHIVNRVKRQQAMAIIKLS